MGGHALAHMSPGAPRRRLVPQPAPPCRGPYAGVQHRRRLRASGVGCSLAPSPTAPSPSASRRAKRSRLRVSLRRHQGDACALPPGLTRDPAQMARSGTDRRSSDRPGSRCSARAPLPPSPPPLRPFHQCVSCVRVHCLSRLYLRAASLLRGSGCPLTLRYICLAYRLKSSLTREERHTLSCRGVGCRVSCARGDCNPGGLRSF